MRNNAVVFVVFLTCGVASGLIRRYYIAAVDQEWDYAPSGRDLVYNHQADADKKIKTDKDRIGSSYVKAVYKQYTDSSFLHEVQKPACQGFVGPTLKGEVGDLVVIHFRNAVTQVHKNFSIHPHGIFYTKSHEGALYMDGEQSLAKLDDAVPPGSSYVYIWNITKNFAPAEADDNCVPWAYHSHVDSMMDIESGLLGILLTCRPGTLNPEGVRNDVQQELVLYADITDETDSHYIGVNMRRCKDPRLCAEHLRTKNADFRESNRKYHINGYSYGNLPSLNVCEGDDVALYIFALSNGIHTMQIYGQTFVIKKHRMDAAAIYPATFLTANMVPINIGIWLLVCRNNDHLDDGMTAFLNVRRCSKEALPDTPAGKKKRYYVAAEEVNWNYMPGGKDLFTSGKAETDTGLSSSSNQNSNQDGDITYKKAVFVEYQDDTFRQMKPRSIDEEHLHLLGAPIKAEVGDIVEVVFLNKASRPYSFFPHGVAIDKSMEGSVYYTRDSNVPYGLIVQPKAITTYRFTIPWTAAPTADDPNCLSYTYHSAVDVRKDTNTGLVGPLLVCKPGSLNEDDKQIHVNKEIFVLMNVIDENLSWYIDESIKQFAPEKAVMDKNGDAFKQSNLIHAINGRIYGTLNGIEMCLGDRVTWHFVGLGDSKDLHGVVLSGNAMVVNGRTLDSRIIIPALGFTAYMHPDNVGKWALYCHTDHHLMTGMSAVYNVNVCQAPQSLPVVPMKPSGASRRYYIAAVEIEWDYAPTGMNLILDTLLSDPTSKGYLYTRTDGGYLGKVYRKAVYREFTDESFLIEKHRGYRDIHLGVLGPYIRAEVGDVIEVVFMNKASHPYSIKPHGVFYNKGNEGMKYNDESVFTEDNAVQPGKVFTYRWTVPQRAGPGANEPNCIGWLYHSGTNMIRDTSSGLMGPLITCRRGVLDARNQRLDQHNREFAMIYYIINENKSWYIRENMQKSSGGPVPNHVEFEESNLMNSINGYIFGNTPGLVMEIDEHVTWYVMGLGSEDDYHTVHFHGQTYIQRVSKSYRGDVVEVFPGTYETVDMLTDNTGIWLLHCHVMKHLVHGMEAKFATLPQGGLKSIEDAERRKIMPVVLHKLPVITTGGSADMIQTYPSNVETKHPPKLTTIVIVPSNVNSYMPIIGHNMQQVTDLASVAQNGHGQIQQVVASPDLLELIKNGVLPERWQILTL